jgi:hypothetical protein
MPFEAWIVSAHRARLEKAADLRFYLTEDEAVREAARLTLSTAPALFLAYRIVVYFDGDEPQR